MTTQTFDMAGAWTASLASLAPLIVLSPSDNSSTSRSRPVFNGTAEPGSTIKIYADEVEIGTATVNAIGQWSVTSTVELGDGAHAFYVKASDPSGNEIASSDVVTFTVDTVIPTVAITSGSWTWDATPLITGTAEDGAAITLTVNGATYKTVAAGGSWSIDLGATTPTSGALSLNLHGHNTVSVIAEDAAHNKSMPVNQTLDIEINRLLIGDSRRNMLAGDIGDDTIYGAGANDALYGGDGIDRIDGGSGNDKLFSDAGADRLYGKAGRDTLSGGLGNDTLTGGRGKDAFVFDTPLGTWKTDRLVNFDRVTDFSVKDDSIRLDNAVFKKLGAGTATKPKALKEAFFTIGHHAKDKNDYLIYDRKTGVLSYDADGSGSKAKAVEFALLKKSLALTAKDFFVI
jgi:Ca2+-binding RTX toxin-like protein